MDTTLPFTKEQIVKIAKNYPTPFHIYDEKGILDNLARFKAAFGRLNGIKEFFAVKALPNPYILRLLQKNSLGADCSSMSELILAERVGITGEEIMFSSNDTPAEEYKKAKQFRSDHQSR